MKHYYISLENDVAYTLKFGKCTRLKNNFTTAMFFLPDFNLQYTIFMKNMVMKLKLISYTD